MCQTFKYISSIFFIGLFSIFSSCTSDSLEDIPIEELNEGYLKIEFELPDYLYPATPTRAMSEKEERIIDINHLSILLFDESPSNKFLYHAPIVENSFQYDKTNPRKATVVLKLAKTEEPTRLVVVANRVIDTSVLKENVTPLNDFLRSMKYQMPKPEGKWNATSGNSEPFPMFGQYKIEKIDEKNKDFSIPMFRALARIDVGVNFEIDPEMKNGPFSDKANGLDNFELKDIRVYRTHDSGFVAPLRDDFKDTPSVSSKVRRLDSEPLHFSLGAGDINSLVREIYVPEAHAPKTEISSNIPNDTIHTLVVGGAFEGGETTYYRVDFAQDDKEKMMRSYYSILRNNRYVFNITAVRSPGFSTPERALKSTSTANLDFQLISWDETIHEMHVNGQHYLGLDNRVIDLSPRIDGDFAKDNFKLVKYQTNYPIENLDAKQVFEWTSSKDKSDSSVSEHFNVEWNKNAKNFKISPKNNNVTNVLITDTLHVKAGTFDLSIIVNQDYLDFVFMLKCETVMVSGAYKPRLILDEATHFIDLEIVAGNESMGGLQYHLYTDTVNGISFEATGIFPKDVLTIPVKMIGKGALNTSLQQQAEPFSMVIKSNSSSGSRCEATISPVLGKINILTFGSGTTYGYNLSNPNTASNYIINEPLNFGPDDDSRVKIEGFNIINGGTSGSNIYAAKIKKWLDGIDNEGVIADIMHIGHSSYINKADIDLVISYLKHGGVLLMFNEGHNPDVFLNNLFPNQDIKAKTTSIYRDCIPFLGHDVYKPSLEGSAEEDALELLEWDKHIEKLKEDPLLNGPFGEFVTKQWGEDASSTLGISGLPNDPTVTIYSRDDKLGQDKKLIKGQGDITSFRLQSTEFNVVFVGDGGFTSQSLGSGDIRNVHICPMWFDGIQDKPYTKPKFPVAKDVEYGVSKDEVYNAPWFANMVAWAINRANSQELMIKKENYRNKVLQGEK